MTHQSFIDKKICVSGTFDFLHEGHKALLKKAFEYSYIYVGLTSDEYCAKKQDVSPYSIRYNNLHDHIKSNFEGKFEIIRIDDIYDFATEISDIDSILVSEETYQNAVRINEKRIQRNMHPLEIITIPQIKDENGVISSSRIRKKNI